jgi:hypothetical protein
MPKNSDKMPVIKTHTIDHRTRQGKEIKRITEGLKSRPLETGKDLLRRIVATNTVVADEIYNHALNTGNLVDEKGNISPNIQKHMIRFQGLAKTALLELLKIGGIAKPDGEPEDAFEELFDE